MERPLIFLSISVSVLCFFLFCIACALSNYPPQFSKLTDHTCTDIALIPSKLIADAKAALHIAYGHTSHGSQLTTGMSGLAAWKGELYAWNEGGAGGALDVDDYFVSGDLGNPDFTTWADRTRTYLDNPLNADVNVVIWSWCGQVSTASAASINTYLALMNQLEIDYPQVTFVYMTGHLDGQCLEGTLHQRNQQIRDYCRQHDKFLYDFADIESYNPDGAYFGDLYPDDNCDYDGDGSPPRSETGNWALEWQNTHTQNVDWYDCSSAHSQPLNANLKAYAAWWLWVSITQHRQ
ncbi:MAG: hypothetical protein JW822_00895 [Spirochaetales bacterium]|nr:hypothetical protein [Spirochaetales bacterium]